MADPLYRYGPNLLRFLDNLAVAGLEGADGEMEVYGENEQGQEGSVDIDIGELAECAASYIRHLEALLLQVDKNLLKLPKGEG